MAHNRRQRVGKVVGELDTEAILARVRVVLVEPSHPGNIGGAARALKTMGLRQLVVVNPVRYPDPQAEWRAAGAQDVLANTRVCGSAAEALGDCHWVVGTSTRVRRIPWPTASARQVAQDTVAKLTADPDAHCAVLFGREASGLTNDELQLCHLHLQIPAAPAYPSLNLAMAVQVVAYELFQAVSAPAGGVQDSRGQHWDRPTATQAQLQGLFEHLQQVLEAAEFLDPDNPGQTLTRLRRLLTRAHPDATEIQILRGILTELGNSGPN